MKRSVSRYSVALMLMGILTGLVILFTREDPPPVTLEHPLRNLLPAMPLERPPFEGIVIVWKARQRLRVLMQKDSLSAQDSLEIKAIDQQLNLLLHD